MMAFIRKCKGSWTGPCKLWKTSHHCDKEQGSYHVGPCRCKCKAEYKGERI